MPRLKFLRDCFLVILRRFTVSTPLTPLQKHIQRTDYKRDNQNTKHEPTK